jgi:hypothetical protein
MTSGSEVVAEFLGAFAESVDFLELDEDFDDGTGGTGIFAAGV